MKTNVSPINPSSEKKISSPFKLEDPTDMTDRFPKRTALDKPEAAARIEPALLLRMMDFMILNREFDERLTKLQRQGRIGFHIGSVGEEAVMIGSAAALLPADWIVPCYREAGVALFRGMDLNALIANMFGNAEDPVMGRQMPCHYVDREHNFLSISSPVGTQIAQAAGVAWAMKIRKSTDVAAVYFGDGATSQGDFHNGLNFAGVFNAPCIFICRNNQWAISTPLSQQTHSATIAQKAIAYGIAAERVDGNDVLACYLATKEAADRARAGKGPTLIEMCTYRQGAHSTSDDPRAYRDQAEVDRWLKEDPIVRFRNFLTEKKLWNNEREEKIRTQVQAQLQAAIERAEHVGMPPLSSLFSEVYHQRTQNLVEQQRELEEFLGEAH